MKRVFLIVTVILVAWNIILTLNMVQISKEKTDTTPTIITHQMSSEFETDYTDVVEMCRNRVVGVVSSTTYDRMANGVIFARSGNDDGYYIVTTYHVVSNVISSEGGNVHVIFANNEDFIAEIVGADVFSDIAVLKVNPDFALEPFVIGDSTVVKEGEWSLAVSCRSNADYYSYFIDGIISGTNRSIKRDVNEDGVNDFDIPLIQISDSIDSSSSGSALVNMNGELIGLLTTTFATDVNESIAIGASEVNRIVNQIVNTGSVERFVLGAYTKDIRTLPLYIKSQYQVDLMLENGVVVTEIESDSIAKNIGLEVGDVILKIDGYDIKNVNQYRDWLYSTENNTPLLTINRHSTEMQIQVTNND